MCAVKVSTTPDRSGSTVWLDADGGSAIIRFEHRGRKIAPLERLRVSKTGEGLGTALIQECESVARKNNAKMIYLYLSAHMSAGHREKLKHILPKMGWTLEASGYAYKPL